MTERPLEWHNGSYDPEFNTEIRKLRPDWFSNTASEAKPKLLRQAREGEARPRQVYDPEFDKIIRELRPNWFTD